MVTEKTRKKILDGFTALCADQRWEAVTLSAIAERAGIGLGQLRQAYGSRLALAADFSARLDASVLAEMDPDLSSEPPRDRLFDVMFSRIEALQGHKAMIRNWGAAARRDPFLALAFNDILTRSMTWMLAGAGIGASGARNAIRAQALALIWTRTLQDWIDDDDPGLARTMAALDRRLRRAERAVLNLTRVECAIDRLLAARQMRPTGTESNPAEDAGEKNDD